MSEISLGTTMGHHLCGIKAQASSAVASGWRAGSAFCGGLSGDATHSCK